VEGDLAAREEQERLEISIHSLRVEGDQVQQRREGMVHISIHSLRVEGDAAAEKAAKAAAEFQSTPSVWRETTTSAAF